MRYIRRPNSAFLLFCAAMFLVLFIVRSTASAADALFEDRYLVSETTYDLAPGITEYVTISNNSAGNDQNIDYFCEVDPTSESAMIMVSYPDYDGTQWKMQTATEQATLAQASFDERGLGYKVVGIINADFYNMTTGEPTGALVMEGMQYHGTNGRNYFAILKDGTAVIRSGNIPLDDVEAAVGGDQLILQNGAITINSSDYANYSISRTAVGVKADGTVVTMVCHGKNWPVSGGYTYYEVAQMMQARGCVDALMLDGSGSSTYASLRAGDSEITLRNSPSDGTARQITSCILLVTKETSDGVFDHAVITPTNEVYTPNSTVNFSYVGVDKANSTVDTLPDLTWQVAEGSAGTINADTGVYTAGSNTGDVTVQLIDASGTVRGENTVVIAVPDQISFSSESVSIGLGETSDLGLVVRYQNRDIHYKDGDLNWEIEPTTYVRKHKTKEYVSSGKTIREYEEITETSAEAMKKICFGTVSDNLFTCLLQYPEGTDTTEQKISSATAQITISSVYNTTVSSSVVVEAGKEPLNIMDFEDQTDNDGTIISAKNFWSIGTKGDDGDSYLVTSTYGKGGTVNAEIVSRADGYPVRFGSNALKLDYSFNDSRYSNGVSGTEGACFGFRDALEIEGNPTAIGVWVYVPEGTPNYWFRMQYTDGSGRTTQLDFTKQYKDAIAADPTDVGGVAPYADGAWHYFEADLTGLEAPLSIPAGMIARLMVVPTEGNFCGKYLADGTEVPVAEREGSIYFDNIQFIYGSNPSDTNLPEITSFTVNDDSIQDNMTFNTNELNFLVYYQDAASLQDTGIDYDNVFLYIDGQRLENTVVDSGAGYIRRDSVKLANGYHTVKLVVTDNYGNERVEKHTFKVDSEENSATRVYLSKDGNATLGGNFNLILRTDYVQNIQSVSLSLEIDKTYKDKFSVKAGDGFELSQSPVYDPVNHTITFTATRTEVTLPEGEAILASITFDIPSTLKNGSSFPYQVEKGMIEYADGYTSSVEPLFGSEDATLPIQVKYSISSDCFVAGLNDAAYFYVTDEDGQPASGVDLYQGDTSLGKTDEYGKLCYSSTLPGTVTVRAISEAGSSFEYTATVNSPAGNTDGTPEMIFHSAVGDLLTQRTITWISNPIYTVPTAVLELSETAEFSNPVKYSGTSELIEFISDTQVTRVNSVGLTDLQSGATYYYRVGDGTQAGWSPIRQFTIPSSDETEGKDILLMSDIQDADNTTANAILGSLDLTDTDLFIQTGDLVDNGGSYVQRMTAYKQLEKLGDINRIYAIGNHETYGDSFLDNSRTLFHTGDTGYSSITYGNLFIATVEYGTDYEKAMEAIVKEADDSECMWRILVIHQPAYYTNKDGGNSDVHNILPSYAEAGGFDFVFSGHDHSYARTKPLKNGVYSEDGVIYVIGGAVGEKGYAISSNLPFVDSFERLTDEFNATYMTIHVDQSSLTVNTYNYTEDGKSELIDTFSKSCSHSKYVYDNGKLICAECGCENQDSNYTGFVEVADDSTKKVYFYLGQVKTGWFIYDNQYMHAGEDGVLHKVEQTNTVTCTTHGYKGAKCECGAEIQGERLNPTGHTWDENHVCTVCGFHGIDVATLNIQLNSTEWTWTGSAKRPVVTVQDDEKTLTRAISIGSGVGEYYLTYPSDSDVGAVTLAIDGMLDYYGHTEVTYKIVPPPVENLTVSDVTTNSVTLSWEASHGATLYRISLYDKAKNTYYYRWSSSDTEYTITGLEPETEYTYRVRAVAEIGQETYTAKSSSNPVTVVLPSSTLCAEHTFLDSTVSPTCESPGGIRHTCAVCGYTYTEITSNATGHTVVTDPAIAPTCTESGLTEGQHCSVCGEVLVEQQVVDAYGHSYGDYEQIDELFHQRTCEVCGDTEISAHIWDSGTITKAATATDAGTRIYICTACGATRVETIPPIADDGGNSSSGSTSSGSAGHGTVATVTGTTDASGKITAAINADVVSGLLDGAKENPAATIEFNLVDSADVKAAEVTIQASSFSQIADYTDVPVKIDTGIVKIVLDPRAVEAVSAAADGNDISISISTVDVSSFSVAVQNLVGTRPVFDISITGGDGTIYSFDGGSAEVSIPYTPQAGEDVNAIVVYCIDNTGALQSVRGAYNSSTKSVDFVASHFSQYAVGYNMVSFADVNTVDWYYAPVTFCAARGITTGTTATTFSPAAAVTRGQFIVMLMRAYEIEPGSSSDGNFVDAGNTYYTNYLAKAKEMGISSGVGNNLFAPDKQITRQEMFTLLYRALNALGKLPETTNSKTLSSFSDASSVSDYAEEAMTALVKSGVIAGSNGTLDPHGQSSRAQMVQVLYNLLSR